LLRRFLRWLNLPSLNMSEINIKLTQEQVSSLLQLVDIAVKAGGIQNAKVALPLVDLIVNAAQPKSE
jgi:hypothetical protein